MLGSTEFNREQAVRSLVIGAIVCLCGLHAQAQLAEPNARGVRFGHVHLKVADIELHKRLWTELFDAVLVEKKGYAAVRVPGALVFFTEGEPTAPSSDTAMDHFGFRVQDLDAVLATWRALGYTVDSNAGDESGPRTTYLTMPGGIRLQLQEDRDLSVKTRMDHIHFIPPKPNSLMTWYSETFGATPAAQRSIDSTLTVPGSSLSFAAATRPRSPTDGTAIDHVSFEVDDWDAFVTMLEGKGVEFEFGPVYIESIDLWVAFFTDPSGVSVEITHGLDQF